MGTADPEKTLVESRGGAQGQGSASGPLQVSELETRLGKGGGGGQPGTWFEAWWAPAAAALDVEGRGLAGSERPLEGRLWLLLGQALR